MVGKQDPRELVANLRACINAMSPLNVGYALPEQGSKPASNCTIGLMLNGCTIEDTMPGSPSFLCGKIKPGDEIKEVDDQKVTVEDVVEKIKGSDAPGSKLKLLLRAADASSKTVELLRQPRPHVIERRDIFLLLGTLWVHACLDLPTQE